MEIKSAFPEKFKEYMVFVKRWKEKPIEENIRNVQRFINRLEEKKINEIETIQFRDILEYQIYLSQQKAGATSRNPGGLLAASTVQHNISSIKNFFKFTNSYYDLGISATRIELPKVAKPKVNFMSHEEIVWILNYIEEHTLRYDIKMRNLLIIKTAFITWMRKEEILNLKFSDIREGSNEVQIIGKWDKVRTVFFSDSLKKDIEHYRKLRQNPRKRSKRAPKKPKDDWGYVFACHSDPYYWQHLSETSIHNLATEFKKPFKERFGHWFSLHSFRHGFATEAIKAGTQIALLKELLGHSDISTTMRYVHLNNQDLLKARCSIPKV